MVGVEADVNLSGVAGGFASPTQKSRRSGSYSASGEAGSDWFSTARLRFGFAADRTLFYVTGGLAIVEDHFSHSLHFQNYRKSHHHRKAQNLPITGKAGGANAVSRSIVNYSWTLGGGVEYALNQNWSAKIEYLFVDMGDNAAASRYASRVCNSPCRTSNFDLEHREKKYMNVVRFGLNYKFGDRTAPVLARY